MRGIPSEQFIQQQLTNHQQIQIQPQPLPSTIQHQHQPVLMHNNYHQHIQPLIPHHHQPVIMHQIRSPSQTILHHQPIFNN